MVLYVFVLVSSGFLNIVSLLVFYMRRTKLYFKDHISISLAVNNILCVAFGYVPQVIYRLGNPNKTACVVSGYFITCLGLGAIPHLAVLAIDRYFHICKPSISQLIHSSKRYSVILCMLCWLYGVLWATLPFFGLAKYNVDDHFTCSIDWRGQSIENKMYNCLLLIFGYVNPIALILTCGLLIKKELKKMKANAAARNGRDSDMELSIISAEKSNRRMVLVMVASFFTAWTPYVVLSGYAFFNPSSFIDSEQTNFLVAVLAKSFTMHNPIIYLTMYKEFRKTFKQILRKSLFKCFQCCICHDPNHGQDTQTCFSLHQTRNDITNSTVSVIQVSEV